MRKAIPIESRVCIALSRLATGSSLIVLSDLFGVGVSTCHEITIEFSRALKKALHSKCIKWPNPARMHTLALDFEDIKGIPNVVGAVDGSHIPIIAPKRHPQDYYNRKGFHSTLLQLVVSARCLIWDYDVGWAGSIHDWNLFQKSTMGKRCANGDLGDYCLVGDAAYPPRVWMLSPYKGHKDGLSQVEYQWNFAQSSTRMAVERAFGILKSRWRILLKRIDMKFEYVPCIVVACIILHNLCITHGDSFDDTWTAEVESDLRLSSFCTANGNAMEREASKACQEALYEVEGLRASEDDVLMRASKSVTAWVDDGENEWHDDNMDESDESECFAVHVDDKASSVGVQKRNRLARALFDKQMADRIAQAFTPSSDSSLDNS